jgi:superkiller protein 3
MEALSPTACLCYVLIIMLFSSGCITYAESQEYYDDRVAAEPNNAEAWCIRGMYYNNYHNQYTEAMESCNKALELDPEYGLAWYLKGVIMTNMNMTDEAAACFENATRYDPGLAQDLSFIAEDT